MYFNQTMYLVLTIFQLLPIDDLIIVTSPQDLVSLIVTKSIKMAQMMDIHLLGVVENMSYIACPDCGKKTSIIKEESYFFALSKYEKRLLEWYKSDKCILPRGKKNEVINFVQNGLKDLSITRTSFSWGVALPKELNEPKHVVYVWLDALTNYITGIGYDADGN